MSVDSTIELIRPIAASVRGTSKTAAHRTPLRIVGRDLLIVLAIVVFAELLLQLIAPQYGHDFYDRTLTASQPVTFNSDGYRGAAVPLVKQPGEFRVLALGDSTTFGTGVAIDDTWPLQLKSALAAVKPVHPVSAMNVALQGASLADMTAAYEQRWAAYQPDAVTVLVSSNMIALAWINRNRAPQLPPYILHGETTLSTKERLAREAGHLCLIHFLSVNTQRALYWLSVTDHRIGNPQEPFGAMLAHGWKQADLPAAEAEEAWNCFARELKGLRDATARHGTKLVVGFSPCRFDLTSNWLDNEKNVPRNRITVDPAARLQQLCQAQQITCINVPTALRSARQQLTAMRGRTAPMYIMFDYNHLDADGHAAVAAAMVPYVQSAVRSAVQ